MGTIVIIDDDPVIRELLVTFSKLQGHSVMAAGTLQEGMRYLEAQGADLIFLDVHLPDGNGLAILPRIHDLPSSPEVIIITSMSDANGAELAIANGAWDYLQKPITRQEIILHMRRALDYHAKKLPHPSKVSLKRDEIVGKSKALSQCLDQVAQCAGTEVNVLITGETGTGKEIFARTIHANSPRARGPFVVVDCASLPEQLVESILFGHARGAFTGAAADRKGLIELADGGTLFLDETGELPLETQKNFLRVLQERTYRPLGKEKEFRSNFRLIAATNRDLEALVHQGLFRSDLFFRINSFHIHLPPLREREKDIDKLAASTVFSICRRNKLAIKGILPETLEILSAYPWPGNVRQLENVLEKAVISNPDSPLLYPVHLPPDIRLHHIRTLTSQRRNQNHTLFAPAHNQPEPLIQPLLPFKEYRRLLTRDIEKHYLIRLMREAKGDIEQACTCSGLGRSRLYGLLKEHGLASSEYSAS